MLTDFREKGKEGRERDTKVGEEHQWVASHTCPGQGPNP